MASYDPRLWGQRPYPSPLQTEAECRSLGLEGEVRSWGGGSGAPWRDERGGPQSTPSMEDRVSYGVTDMGGSRRPWLGSREEEEGSWGATNRVPQETPREYRSPNQEGRSGSCEPPRKRARSPPVRDWLRVPLSPPREVSWESPQKRVRSPPMDEWWRVPLSPPRGRGSTSHNSQRQPSAPSTHQELLSSSSRRDSPSNGGSPWVSWGRSYGPETESRGRSQESPEPAWESCRDLKTLPSASQRATEGRDLERSRWPGEPGSSTSSHHRSRGDITWETRHGNPVDGSYSVKAEASREHWCGRGFQSFLSQHDSREQDNRGPKGWQDEGWARDEGLSRKDWGHSVGFPRESIPQKGQGAKGSFQGNFMGPKGGPERYEGHGTQAATTGRFFPRLEVANYWTRCNNIMLRNARDQFLSFCPRPYIPDQSSIPPIVNPLLDQLIGKHNKDLSTNLRFSLQTQWDVLSMLAPAMAVYEMAEAAMERQEGVDPRVVHELARCLLSFAGSANQKLRLQRCSQVLQAIDPQLASMVTKISNPNSGDWLFAEDNVDTLKGVVLSLQTLPQDPSERNSGNHREAGRHTLMASPLESAAQFQAEAALLPEPNSGQQAQLQDEASLELWHRRFGHANSNIILRLQRHTLVTGIKVDAGEACSTAKCITCLTEWGLNPPFPFNTVRNSKALMDLVHCELFIPFDVPSLTLHKYVLIFVDDFSRFCVTYLLKETGETHECFKSYLVLLRKWHKTPRAFQMNSVANAVSSQTLEFLEAQGIAHKRGVKSIHGKSRTAEKEIKSLLVMTRCMLADAMLPKPFWGQAIPTATYLHNRLACSKRKRSTCFKVWFGTVPNVKHLRVFGSLALNRQKPMDDVQHIFVGYSSDKSVYQIMNLETGEILTRRNQDFNEGKGVKKRGKFLEAVERDGCDIETPTGIVVSTTPQPE